MKRISHSLEVGVATAVAAGSIILPNTSVAYATPEANPSTENTTISPRLGEHIVMASLGDSIAAGFGSEINPGEPTNMGKYETGTTWKGVNECHRLPDGAYGALVAKALNVNRFIFVPCAGAETRHIRDTPQWDTQPPQSYALTKDTNLVTITIGGNDKVEEKDDDKGGAFVNMLGCVVNPTNPLEKCTESSPAYTDGMHIVEDLLPGRLDATFNDIKERVADDATIIVKGYKNPMPESIDTLPVLSPCRAFITEGELRLSNTFVTALNAQLSAAALRAGANFRYVDSPPLREQFDHAGVPKDACSLSPEAGSWSIRFAEPNPLDPKNSNFSFHPTKEGQELLADEVLEDLPAR